MRALILTCPTAANTNFVQFVVAQHTASQSSTETASNSHMSAEPGDSGGCDRE